ncbi:MAG: DUF523 domain-containing protein [Oscillospiraceae bacterium]|jgi:uncharacterized protein YbbK (DUF523 family)|nr:DUF523 domain-containing protein [Oscillospiraceae bacterium]
MKKILVSGYLYGWHCRYDAVDCPCTVPQFLQWKAEGRLVPVCPETFGGLKTPRPDAQIVGSCVKIGSGEDVTQAYRCGAKEALRLAQENDVVFAVMKEDSPSCGSKYVYDGTFTDVKRPGQGCAVQLLRDNGFLVMDENEIDQAAKFLQQAEE